MPAVRMVWNGNVWYGPGSTSQPPVSTPKKIALIGDSTLWQDGFGEARMRALLEPTFQTANIFFYAASGKDIYSADTNGYNTLTNIAQARTALGGEPDLWLINLGSNGHNTTDSDINYKINLIMSQLTAPVLWNAISQKDGYTEGTNSVATRLNWNTKASAKMATYTNGRWMDWHAYVKAKPGGDDSLWRADYVHMTNEGYDYKNAYNMANILTALAALPVTTTSGYDVVVGWIQSNMRGAATDYADPTDTAPSNVYEWNWSTNTIVPATLPGSNLDGFNGMGVMTSFVNDYATAHPDRKVLRLNVARGGTGFATPSTNTSNGTNYTNLSWRRDLPDTSDNLALVATRQVQTALSAAGTGSKIVAMLANHGSTDGTQNTPKATFKSYLQDWITWMRTQLPVSGIPYLMMQMRPDLVAAETRHAIIDAAQSETASELTNVGYVLSPTDTSNFKADSVHFNAKGVREIGHRLYTRYAEMVAVSPPDPPVGEASLAGAKTLGTASYSIPSSNVLYLSTTGSDANPGTLASPKGTLDGVYAAASSGDTIVIRGGEYRQNFASNVNKTLTFQNYPGEVVWFDGSDVVTGWSGSGPWTKAWTVEHDHSTSFTSGDTNTRWIDSSYPYAAWPDMLFVDGVRQTLVGPSATPSTGQWCHDYDSNIIKLGTDPTGKEIRVAVRERFAIIKQPDTVFRGIGMRRYATGLSQIGTIFGSSSGPRAIVENCWMVDCGQQSASLSGSGSILRSCSIIRPGCTGFHSANTTSITVDKTWVDYANYRRFKNEPAAASIKLTEQRDCLIKDSVFTNSYSYGIWFDTDTININVIGNKVDACAGKAIHIEAGHNCIVAGNYVSNTPFGIMNMISSDWRAWNNTVDNSTQFDIGVWQDERRNVNPATMAECPWVITGAEMANNVMTFKAGTSGHLYQMYALDRATNRPANDMVSLLAGNLFSATSTSPLESNQMIGWGGSTNVISGSMIYKTPTAFSAGVAKAASWVNSITPYTNPTTAQIRAFDSAAVALPANVATALGLTVGTKIVGPPRPAPELVATSPEGA